MKNKLTRIFTIVALLAGLFTSSSYGQTFGIESFDGSKQLIEISPLNERGTLTIKGARNTIHISNINYIDTVHLLNKQFLLITYHFRAGSGISAAKTLLLSTNNQTLCESFHITSLFKEEFLDFSKPLPASDSVMKTSVKTVHKVNLSLLRCNGDNYTIRATIHDERKSIDEPNTNYNNDIVSNLNFDRSKNIFYSSQEEIAPYFTRAYAKKKHSDKESIKGIFPVAKLGKQLSYYKAGKWHELPEVPE
ncbi:hypothetical protein MON38_07610 [Hymenobacter sp. DH14]|uniref:DUF4369 domain-containing protein n=1 Tax=Hymenobacter cyanobacteriorum TaxID=2926463 RepID=A0A9X2AG64_9BACT|nr:hypothetical protein [Hymenobacter cyanobacteriorum]MCI1187283.1 hypothetical protein [Hymenobacter cyanobacteriorum]